MNNLKAINERYIQDIDDEDDEIVTSDITKHYDKNFRISVSVKKCTADDFIPSMEYIKDMLDDIFDVYFELDGYETVLLAQDNANNYELVEINERNCKKFFDIKELNPKYQIDSFTNEPEIRINCTYDLLIYLGQIYEEWMHMQSEKNT